jgi:hypothetical protein
MIEAVLTCRCGMRYRSGDAHSAVTRPCLCGGPLSIDQRATLRALIIESDAPLEVLIERVRSLSDRPI